MGRPQEEQHGMVPCKGKESSKETIPISECCYVVMQGALIGPQQAVRALELDVGAPAG